MLTKEEREKIRLLCTRFDKRPSINATLEMLDTVDNLEADLDRWKARAEALERAVQQYIPCTVCIHKGEDCEGCKIWLESGAEHWEFDEARFSEGKEYAHEDCSD